MKQDRKRANSAGSETVTITAPKVLSLTEPLGIDETPIFSWCIQAPDSYNLAQTAYQVRISSSRQKAEEGIADIWDSTRVNSANTVSVPYTGPALCSKTTYFWTVESVVGGKVVSSAVQRFSTGILQDTQWQAQWIGMPAEKKTPETERAAVLLRKEFRLDKPVKQAYVYLCGLGFFELLVNGTLPDDSVLNPFTSQYDQTVLYRTFDVTALLRTGENALSVELGNSFFNETVKIWNWDTAKWRDDPKLIFQLEVEYADGSSQCILSDSSWKATVDGPITTNSMYYGETYDARKELPGFSEPGFDDADWSQSTVVSAPPGALRAQCKAPVKKAISAPPQSIVKLQDPGSYLITTVEMMAGWIRLQNINEAAGNQISITYGQQLNEAGGVLKWGGTDGRDSNGFPFANLQRDHYICKGTPNEAFEPKFSYKSHKYIQIDGYHGELTAEDITIFQVTNSVEALSSFECSEPMLNTLHRMMCVSIENNFHGEHCDPLIEKNGWLGDVNVSLPTLMYNYDMPACLPALIDVMKDCQKEYGFVPIMTPTANWGIHNYPVWNTLLVYGVKALADYFGSLDYAKKQYDAMRKMALLDIEQIKANGWVWLDVELADWVSPMGGTDPHVPYVESASEGASIAATAYVYKMLDILAEFAEDMGKEQDVREYREAMECIYTTFNEKFYRKEQGIYETNFWHQHGTRTKYRQTSNLVPLAYGLVPEERIPVVMQNLVQDIIEKEYHLDTGCVGTRLILPILCDYGYGDVAYRIMMQKTYPSWGFCLEQGVASTWEMWECSSRSFDHYFLGTYDEWFFSHLAGIRDIRNGYETFVIQPEFLDAISYVDVSLRTIRGTVSSKWEKEAGGRVHLYLEIPVGAKATVILPTIQPLEFCPAECFDQEIAKSGSVQAGKTHLLLGSGKYEILADISK